MTVQSLAKPLQGTISLNPKGFGFVRGADGQDAFVPPGEAGKFLSGDVVSYRAEVDRRGKTAAVDLKLVQGNPDLLVGQVEINKATGEMFLVTEDFNSIPLVVRNNLLVNEDVVVAARVVHRPAAGKHAPKAPISVEIERIVGVRGSVAFDREYALARNSLESQFTSEALSFAYRAVHDYSAPNGHVDLTGLNLVTIDGASTRDIDDAVLVQRREDAPGYLVSVAIADVSHYVRPGTPLDKEAFRRATSVYLPGRVVPMLPEALSNGVCSLAPNVKRFAVVLQMVLDEQGTVIRHEYKRAEVRSRGAVTYDAVSKFIDNADKAALPPLPEAVLTSLQDMHELHTKLQAHRDRMGRIDLDDVSISVVQRQDGSWSRVVEERNTAERCVESMMLLANTVTAKHLAQLGSGIYRVQPAPSQDGWNTFRATVKEMYGHVVTAETPSVPAVLELLDQYTKGSEEYSIILSAYQAHVPRASYSSAPGIHFALNAPGYTQFTSPIRRYADLAVHRIILGGQGVDTRKASDIAEACTKMSGRSSLAEFDLTDKAKKAIYLTEFAALETAGRPVEQAQVIRNTKRGLRLRLPTLQFSVFLGEEELLKSGHSYDPDTERWVRPNGKPVVPGSCFKVRMSSWQETAKSYELNVTLA